MPTRCRVIAGSVRADGEQPGRGIVEVPAIPSRYAEFLTRFGGHPLIVEMQLHGETASGTKLQTQLFRYSINICEAA